MAFYFDFEALDRNRGSAEQLHFLNIDVIHIIRGRDYAFVNRSVRSTWIDKIRLLISKECGEVELPQSFANVERSLPISFILKSTR